jgi:hypothetical protein
MVNLLNTFISISPDASVSICSPACQICINLGYPQAKSRNSLTGAQVCQSFSIQLMLNQSIVDRK